MEVAYAVERPDEDREPVVTYTPQRQRRTQFCHHLDLAHMCIYGGEEIDFFYLSRSPHPEVLYYTYPQKDHAVDSTGECSHLSRPWGPFSYFRRKLPAWMKKRPLRTQGNWPLE